MVNKTECKEIVAKHEQSHTDSPIKSAVKNLNTKFGVAMKDVVSEAFEQFDADLSKTLDSHEVEEFLSAYLSWISKSSEPLWHVLQKPRLVNIIQVFASTLCEKCDRKDLLTQVRAEFLKIINFDEFEEATRKDVAVVCEVIRKHKAELAKDLIECCDKDKDGLLKYDEFVTCANLDFIQRLTRRETTEDSNSQSHYSELWNKKSTLLVEKFCDICKSVPQQSSSSTTGMGVEGVPRIRTHRLHRRNKSSASEICQAGCMATCLIS